MIQYWRQISIALLVLAVLGFIKYQDFKITNLKEQVSKEQAHVVELQGKLKLQNDAILKLKADSDTAKAEGELIIKESKKVSDGFKNKAQDLYTKQPVGEDCAAAIQLGNSK